MPLGGGAWLLARAVLPESRSATTAGRLDVGGLLSSGGGLLALLLALTEGNSLGWGSARVIALLVAAVAGFALFVWRERRAATPLIDMAMLRERSFAGANVVILLATSVMCSLFFFLALYLQTATIVVVAPAAGRLADRIGARIPVTAGMALLAAALLGLSALRVESGLASIVPWLALAGLGTTRWGGRSQAFVDGFSTAVSVNAAIALACAVLAAVTLRSRPRSAKSAHRPATAGNPRRLGPRGTAAHLSAEPAAAPVES